MDAAYFQAAIPEPFRILGLKLKPLSLGRYLLLRRFNCAFVAEEEASAGVPDLLLGLVICSMRVDEFLAAAESHRLARDIRRWGRRVCPRAWISCLPIVGRWWRKNHACDALEKMRLFQRYIQLGSVVPKYWDEGRDQRMSGSHWSHGVEVCLRGELGWSQEEINEAPLTKALADYFKFAENQGLVRLMSDYEIELIAAAERSEREMQRSPSPRPLPPGEGEAAAAMGLQTSAGEVACGA